MLTVLRVQLPSDVSVVGCEIAPCVLLGWPNGSISSDDVLQLYPHNKYSIMYKWYRDQGDQKAIVCSMHPNQQATLQCLVCLKEKVPIAKSYHCTTKCLSDAWQHHRSLHDQAKKTLKDLRAAEAQLFGCFNGSDDTISMCPTTATKKGGEAWSLVGLSKAYTPTSNDINHVLKLDCVAIDMETRRPVGNIITVFTSRVIPAPSPTPRHMIPVNGDLLGQLDINGQMYLGNFSVLSYNILSDAVATNELYSYCPTWALSWPYRRQNLLQEIIGYHADILCLQEVQNDHFEEFFGPELEKHGYQAVFSKCSSEVYDGKPNTLDGCATFFRRDRFSLVKKYELDFNKAAQSSPEAPKKVDLVSLTKNNIALVLVLERKLTEFGVHNPRKKNLICVANTHVNVKQEREDIKLWQVLTLLRGLENISLYADIPMLVCGDFNSVPGSTPHALLANGSVDQLLSDLAVDPVGNVLPVRKLTHQLPLVSAYSSFARMAGANPGLQQQRRRMDASTHEPLFTNFTRDFVGTVDYIFYTADSLSVESLLELVAQEDLHKNTAIPSPEWSSDHIALLAEFRCKPRHRDKT
ncbi:carbon catabolite repressor protein [Canna indica]|uniref:poly(A)-specific ribonuclease n=1 Tax=Canna indica TaxID=4628 RepID=A0AAQ3KX78_9LILI|nr:carbon catabolite repressor protein [Canna indica]